MAKPKAWLSWSSGKDSAWALQKVREQGEFEVRALLTTVNETHHRVAMHAVREDLLDQQAAAVGAPLIKIPLPWPCSNEDYEARMAAAMADARRQDITHIIFGDLFLEDVRRYREERLVAIGVTPVFPLWGLDTADLARQMLRAGLGARLTCVDPKKLDRSFAGRLYDAELLDELPSSVDPCGENGEFHTFAFSGPIFRHPVDIAVGAVVDRDGFVFSDLLPLNDH